MIAAPASRAGRRVRSAGQGGLGEPLQLVCRDAKARRDAGAVAQVGPEEVIELPP